MTTMGAGATVKGVGEEIQRALRAVTTNAEDRVRDILDAGGRTLTETLDPDVRSSVTARALEEIASVHDDLLARLDPDRAGSHTARVVSELSALLGPGGILEKRLTETLDPAAGDSAMGRLVTTIEGRFTEIRDLIVGESGRAAEAERGTAKGVDYEDEVVAELRRVAAEISGCTVEATGHMTGALDARAMVGDAVFALPDGTRVAIEAKNAGSVALAGKDGILEELDRALTNRKATWAICISKNDAFPLEVGAFAIYGNRVLLVDDGDGVLLRVALRWIQAGAELAGSGDTAADLEAARNAVERLRRLAQRFTGAKRALAGVRSSVDQVRGELDCLRIDLLDLVEDLHLAVRSTAEARFVDHDHGATNDQGSPDGGP